jgi:CBS domain-containing protein
LRDVKVLLTATVKVNASTSKEARVFSQRVGQVMLREPLVVAGGDASVSEAARLMTGSGAGAVVVIDADEVIGIFSGRDAVHRVLGAGREPQTTRLAEVMTPNPVTVDAAKTYGHALRQMQELGFRHMPVVDAGKVVGIVSARNVFDPEMEEFVSEQSRRESFG